MCPRPRATIPGMAWRLELHRRQGVQREEVVELLGREVDQVARGLPSGVVDQDVDGPVLCLDRADQGAPRCGIDEVGDDHVGAQRLGNRAQIAAATGGER